MKMVTAVIKPFKLDEVKLAVQTVGVKGLTVTQSRGFGASGGHIEIYRGKEYEFDFTEKIRVECICTDELVETLIEAIVTAARTDVVGDGIAWVTDIEHVVRIRTNERGPAAI
jgi:nitrogen regulatory protein P-II 1